MALSCDWRVIESWSYGLGVGDASSDVHFYSMELNFNCITFFIIVPSTRLWQPSRAHRSQINSVRPISDWWTSQCTD